MSVFIIFSVFSTFCMVGIVLTLAESLYSYVYNLEFTLWVDFLCGLGKEGVLFPPPCDRVNLNCTIAFGRGRAGEKRIKKKKNPNQKLLH